MYCDTARWKYEVHNARIHVRYACQINTYIYIEHSSELCHQEYYSLTFKYYLFNVFVTVQLNIQLFRRVGNSDMIFIHFYTPILRSAEAAVYDAAMVF